MAGKPGPGSMNLRSVLKGLAVVTAIVILAVIAAAAWIKLAPRRTPGGQPPLVTLTSGSLGEFRRAFDAGHGEVRILALLSPT